MFWSFKPIFIVCTICTFSSFWPRPCRNCNTSRGLRRGRGATGGERGVPATALRCWEQPDTKTPRSPSRCSRIEVKNNTRDRTDTLGTCLEHNPSLNPHLNPEQVEQSSKPSSPPGPSRCYKYLQGVYARADVVLRLLTECQQRSCVCPHALQEGDLQGREVRGVPATQPPRGDRSPGLCAPR